MMREIKFRAWNILIRKIVQWEEIEALPAWKVLSNNNERQVLNAMQYTGMKDTKNVKEIYEGDYVKRTSLSPGGENIEGVVDFIECGFVITDRKTFAKPLFTEIDDIEIIGNIYENPELLCIFQ